MVRTGDTAPDVTAPLANGDIERFDLSEALDEGPLVLAFFPGAFTSTCTTEMRTFQESLEDFESVGARIFGVSVDTPFSLNEFREKHELEFGFISDHAKELIEAFDVATDISDIGFHGVAKRSVFVIDEDGTITYAWVSEDGGVEPDYDAVAQAAADAAK